MKKLHLVLLSIGLLTITFVNSPNLHSDMTNIALAQKGFSWRNLFSGLFTPKPPIKPRRGGSRGDICMVSPDLSGEKNQPRIVWSDKPLFLWRGSLIKTVGLSSSADLDKNIIFSHPIAPTQEFVSYKGKALQPGETYYWWLSFDKSPNAFVSFKVMEPEQRQRIAKDLQKLEQEKKTRKATAEGIALAKTKYFLKQQPQLWSDALQQAYLVSNPSPELSKLREDIVGELCKSGRPGS
ncbi:MAG: DUF928 domain-containing protein [Scytonematopsis contorta HA4267-MV1]|jgi:hypothetical protein|nr:DUF928 domain-containing protein [Scytonematopsis contorta HA4267-MV1]